MSRLWQIFVAPDSNLETLPVESSPWSIERMARLPREHWELILKFAKGLNIQKANALASYSKPQDYFKHGDTIHVSSEELISIVEFMKHLTLEIAKADPLAPEPTREYPENYTNDEHVRMLNAVAAVFQESLRLHRPF